MVCQGIFFDKNSSCRDNSVENPCIKKPALSVVVTRCKTTQHPVRGYAQGVDKPVKNFFEAAHCIIVNQQNNAQRAVQPLAPACRKSVFDTL